MNEKIDDDMKEQPETPSVYEDTPTSEEDPNEFLLGDEEDPNDEVVLEEYKEKGEDESDD